MHAFLTNNYQKQTFINYDKNMRQQRKFYCVLKESDF